jgi:glycosyltransferase involved in cell wall biosynthesis
MTELLKDKFNLDESKIITKQYGIDLATFSCHNLNAQRKYTFITNRTFIENSNYFLLLDVMKEIRSRLDFLLLIVGSGPLKSQIEAKVIDLKLEKNVIIKNAVSHTQLVKYLNDSLIYISMTSSDGTPLSVFEAAACGAYPLLSDIQPNREWLKKGLIGTCVTLNNQDSIVNTIIEFIGNVDDSEFRSKNIKFVNKEMDYNKNMRHIEDQLRHLI